jgi:ketosteroid isomerase-like protein
MAMAPDTEAMLRRTYEAFNRKDLDTFLAAAHPDVDWPNVLVGSRVIGVGDIRSWWERQFRAIDPQLHVLSITEDDDGAAVVRVRQVVRFVSDGEVLLDEIVQHVCTFRDGLIKTIDLRDDDGNLIAPPRSTRAQVWPPAIMEPWSQPQT